MDEMVTKKKKSKVKKAFDIISTSIVVLLFGFAIFYQIVSLTTRDSNYGVTNFFGNQINDRGFKFFRNVIIIIIIAAVNT